MFELAGEPVTVTPEPGVEVDPKGTTVQATSPGVAPDHNDAVTVERVPAAPDGEVLLPEQLFHPTMSTLRNAVGLIENGVDTVHLRHSGFTSPGQSVVGHVLSEESSILFVSADGPVPLRITTESQPE